MKPPAFVHFNLAQINPLKKLPEHGIYSENIVFFRFLTFCGLFPLHCDKNGYFELKWKSWEAIYSLVYITLGTIFSLHGSITVITNFKSHLFNFEESVYYATFLNYPVTHVITILTLLRAKTIADYLNKWDKFVVCFERVSGSKAPRMRQRSWLYASIGLSVINVGLYFAVDSPIPWIEQKGLESKLYSVLLFSQLISSTSALLLFTFLAIKAGWCKVMSKALFHDLWVKNLVNKSLGNHVVLWLNLRDLCTGFGDVFWMSYCYFWVYLFGLTLPALYLRADGLRTGNFFGFLQSSSSVFFICLFAEIAHGATNMVGKQFEQNLSTALLEEKFTKELRKFLKIIAPRPVSMSMGGFVVLDRVLMVSMISTLIAYIIVIIQFHPDV